MAKMSTPNDKASKPRATTDARATADAVRREIEREPGILNAEIDAPHGRVRFEYDGAKTTDRDIEQVAGRVAPALNQHFDKCLLRLEGRACEACALKLERKAQEVPGVHRATATFLGGIMSITYDHQKYPCDLVIEKIRDTGAPVKPYDTEEKRGRITEDRVEIAFTGATLAFMIVGAALGRWTALPAWSLYLLAYITGGYFGVRSSITSLRQKTIDIDLLMVLAALGAAYVGAPFEGAMLLFLFSLSNVLQSHAMDRTRKAISSLMQLRPSQALVRRGGETVTVPIDSLNIGDITVIRPGENIPLDGVIVDGESEIDQASLTGESIPVGKGPGDTVFAATTNQTGSLDVRVTRSSRDSTIARLIRMVEEAQAEKANTQRFLERAEQHYALGVILFTLGLIAGPALWGTAPFEQIFYRAMTVMVVASPCALIISTPASILSAIGGSARKGVLFKGGVFLERMAGVKIVAFDKTGTLTRGAPVVTDVVLPQRAPRAVAELDEAGRDLLTLAASLEARSEHLIGQAIVASAKRAHLKLADCGQFKARTGRGVSGIVRNRQVLVGNVRYLTEHGVDLTDWDQTLTGLQRAGKTPVLVGEGSDGQARVLGVIAVADVLRDDARETVRRLRAVHGVEQVVMLTGDHEEVAAAVAHDAGVDAYHAELLPDDKVRVVRELKARGPVAMVGDGINDAPALAASTVGMAMGAAGTDIAMETADVVLMSNNLDNVPFALAMSRRARRVVFQNLAFAMSVIAFLVVAALGFDLPLTLGVVGHEGSTVLVCLNGLRLLRT